MNRRCTKSENNWVSAIPCIRSNDEFPIWKQSPATSIGNLFNFHAIFMSSCNIMPCIRPQPILMAVLTILHLTQALEMSDLEYISDEVDFKPCQTTPLAPSDFNEQEVSAGQLLNVNPCPPPKESAWSKGPQGLVKRSKLVCSWSLSPYIVTIRKSSTKGLVKGDSATSDSPRSKPSNPVTQTHSRRSSTLGQAAPLNDGDSVSNLNLSASKQSKLLPAHFLLAF